MSEVFIPSWAARELGALRQSPFDAAFSSALEDFFDQWEALHNTPNDKQHRKQAEDAAEELVRRAYVVRHMKQAKPVNGSERGS